VPEWLRAEAEETRDASRSQATTSRKRKPSVKPAPSFGGIGTVAEKVPGPQGVRQPGTKPPVWDDIHPILVG